MALGFGFFVFLLLRFGEWEGVGGREGLRVLELRVLVPSIRGKSCGSQC